MDYRGSFFALRFCIALLSQMSLLEQFICFLASDVPSEQKAIVETRVPPSPGRQLSLSAVECLWESRAPVKMLMALGLGVTSVSWFLCLHVPSVLAWI